MHKIFFFLLLALFFLPAHSQLQQTQCEKLKSDWIRRKAELERDVSSLPSGQKLIKNDLKKIIYPEYAAFDSDLNTMEKGLIKFFYNLSIDKYNRISIGPF